MRNPFKSIFKRGNVSDPGHWILRLLSHGTSSSGKNVTADEALKVSAVLACVRVIAETIASLPLFLYRRTGDNGKEPATSHPLFPLLHDAPNGYQTAYEFREIQAAHLNLRGNSFARKVVSARGRLEELIPLIPANMQVERVDGRIVYRYTHEDGKQEEIPAERIWHVKNMPISSSYNSAAPEGLVGLSPVSMAREAIGLSLAADEYGGKYFANYAQTGLSLEHPGKLGKPAKEFLKESLAEYSKPENKFKSLILEEGMKINKLGMTNEDSQFLESRQFQIEEIARIFRVPPVLIGHPTNTMTYASAEQLFLSFATYTIRPWCVRLEQSANRWLIPDKERGEHFFEHVMAGLLRGDTLSRFQAYAQARQWGWVNVDEIRAFENMNPLPEGKGKIYLQPLNMNEAGAKPPEKGSPNVSSQE